jgi:site-specific recombinase XerD
MKNMATEDQSIAPDELPDAWRDALNLLDGDLRLRAAAERTRRAYSDDAGQFAAWCRDRGMGPEEVTTRMLRRYAAGLSSGAGDAGPGPAGGPRTRKEPMVAATVARKLASLRALYRTLREHGMVAANPADLVQAPKRAQKLPRVLKPDEVSALLDRIPASTPLDVRDRALFELAYACGLRAEELISLDVTSVDFDGEELRVEGKGSKTRILPVGETALRALGRYLEQARPALVSDQSEPALLLSKTGRRLSTSDVRRRLRVWTRHAAVQGGAHPHALRHSFATHLRTIKELLGHASISTTQIYTRVESARLKSAYARSHPRA